MPTTRFGLLGGGAVAGILCLWAVISAATSPALALELQETPMFRGQVAAGTLPPIDQRVPEDPSIVTFSGEKTVGRPGGELRTLIGRAKDVRLLVVYGYARLIGYNENFELVPDILESYEVEEGRRFTFHLRKGHKWSDGAPFTTEDIRYWWEDIANNKKLSPAGPVQV